MKISQAAAKDTGFLKVDQYYKEAGERPGLQLVFGVFLTVIRCTVLKRSRPAAGATASFWCLC